MDNQPSYKLVNYVSSCLTRYKLSKHAEDPSKRITLKSIVQELADYCSLSRNTIIAIKQNERQPSLEKAILIAQFFKEPMEDIFVLKVVTDKNEKVEGEKEDGTVKS